MSTATPLPLDEFHNEQGAEWTIDGGVRVPGSYGDAGAELSALRQGCALWDGSAVGRIEMTGEDRHRFLNGLVTAAVIDLEPGSSRYGLFTSIKGRVLADVDVIVDTDRIWLRLPTGEGETIRQHMVQYVIVDRVELRLLDERLPIVLAGPLAEERLIEWTAAEALPVEPGSHCPATVLGTEVHLLREERLGTAGFSLWVAASDATDLVTAMSQSAVPPTPVGLEAIEVTRIAAGIPRFGIDFGDDTFPQEADLDSAVSYEKGCYLGQEVVARIHFRGGVNRVLRGLRVAGGTEIAPGTRVLSSGRDVGRLTSVARSGEQRVALAMLAMSAAAPGACVELGDGVTAEVEELPFDRGLDSE